MCVSQITSVPRFPWLDHHLDFLKMAQTKKKNTSPPQIPQSWWISHAENAKNHLTLRETKIVTEHHHF